MITDISQIPPELAVHYVDHLVNFIREHKGRIHIVKPSGKIVEKPDLRKKFAKEVVRLSRDFNLQVPIVHGAGVQITDALKQKGKQSVFDKDKLRVTQHDHVEIADRATLNVNALLCEEIDAAGEGFVIARGMPGWHPDLNMTSTHMDPENNNYSGEKVLSMNTGQLRIDLERENIVPVLTNMCQAEIPVNGINKVNVNADAVANALASRLQAYRLLLCSDVPGVLEPMRSDAPQLPKDPDEIREVIRAGLWRVIPEIKPNDVPQLLSRGIIDGGMVVKVNQAFETAAKMGPGGAVVILDHNFSAELVLPQGYGTIFRAPALTTGL